MDYFSFYDIKILSQLSATFEVMKYLNADYADLHASLCTYTHEDECVYLSVAWVFFINNLILKG